MSPTESLQAPGSSVVPQAARRDVMISAILDTAAKLFVEKGYAGTSLLDIADVMGLSRAALYRYVRNKSEILELLVGDSSVAMARIVEVTALRTDLSSFERLEEAVRGLAVPVAKSPLRFWVLTVNEQHLPEQVQPLARDSRRGILDGLIRLIAEASRDGSIRPVDEHVTAFLILGGITWFARWYSPEGRMTPESLADHVVDIYIGGLRRPNPTHTIGGAVAAIREDLAVLERLVSTTPSKRRPRP